jgi:phosphomannomutase/phosphoglucomutase
MNTISEEILKSCDIRGIYPRPLGNLQAEQVGMALGALIKKQAQGNIKTVVGCDIRVSGETLKKTLIRALSDSGLKVYDAGLVSTPLLAFATGQVDAAVGIMITASHNPPNTNGFKFFLKGLPASPAWLEQFYQLLRQGSSRKGAGIIEKKDFLADYRNAMVNRSGRNLKNVKLVIDPGNGMTALTAPPILKALHCVFEVMNPELDGNYPGRGADSSRPETLTALGERVRRSKAHFGAAFDGDGDRVSFVDEKGIEVPNDLILCLLAKHFLKGEKNPKVVYDAKCSDWVEKVVQTAGGTAILEKSGHSYIYARMREEKAILGGEASGHFFLPGPFPGDALFACLKVVEIVLEGKKPFSEFFQEFPKRVSTHDIKIQMEPQTVADLYRRLHARAEEMGAKVSTVDGIRAVFGESWGIARRSVTEPVVGIRMEAPSAKKLEELSKNWLREFPEIQKMVLESQN